METLYVKKSVCQLVALLCGECSQTGRVGLFLHVCRNVTQSQSTTTTTKSTTNTANAVMKSSADNNKYTE